MNQPVTKSNRGGARVGAGRKPTRERYATLINATERHLAAMLRDDVPIALRELVRGVVCAEETEDGRRIYYRPPDVRAIQIIIDRILGREMPAVVVQDNSVRVLVLGIEGGKPEELRD